MSFGFGGGLASEELQHEIFARLPCSAPLRFAMLAVETFINKQHHILWTIIFLQTLAIYFIISREVLHSSVQCYRLNKNNPFISIFCLQYCVTCNLLRLHHRTLQCNRPVAAKHSISHAVERIRSSVVQTSPRTTCDLLKTWMVIKSLSVQPESDVFKSQSATWKSVHFGYITDLSTTYVRCAHFFNGTVVTTCPRIKTLIGVIHKRSYHTKP